MPKKGTKATNKVRRNKKNDQPRRPKELKDRAESILAQRLARKKKKKKRTDKDLHPDLTEKKLIRALKLKQIELGLHLDELKESHLHLEAARREYAALFDHAPIGYVVLDRRGMILNANPAAAELLKDEQDAILHKTFASLLPKEFRNDLKLHLEQVFSSSARLSCEIMIKGKSKAPFWAELTSSPLEDENNQQRTITLVKDITERKKSERDLDMARSELEERVQERTAEVVVANQRLNLEIAERKRKEEALKQNEAKYRELVENANSIILRVNMDGVITFANEFAESFFGYSEGELADRNLVGSIVPEHETTGRDLSELIQHILNSPDEYAINENENVRSDGSRVWVSWTNKVVTDLSGRGSELLCIGTDITARKEMEEELRRSEARFRGIVEDQTELIRRARPDGTVTWVNQAYARYYGKKPEELIGTRFRPNIPPDDAERVENIARSLTPESPVANYEHRVITDDGRVLWQHWVDRAIFNDQGEPEEYQSVGRRITKRKEAEEALKENREFLRRIIDTVPNPIFVKNENFEFVLVNKAMGDLFGIKPEDMLGKSISDFSTNADEIETFDMEDKKVLESGEPLLIPQKSITGKDGVKRWYSNTKLPLPGKREILGVAVDITERVRAEHQRNRMEKQVRHSQKMQALGTLAGGIAHDFNNMIFAILGFARLALGKAPKGGKTEEYIKQIESAGLRASELVRQILTFSRRTEQEKQPVLVASLVKEIGKMLSATLPPSVELHMNIQDEEVKILGDPTQIHQVLLNLSTNAGHAMRESGGRLDVELYTKTVTPETAEELDDLDAGEYVVLTVRDTGSGMTPGVKDRIFEPFFTTKGPNEGTGMGLSVVHGIVESHNGSVMVDTAPGKGTEFRVFFPRLEMEEHGEEHGDNVCPTGNEHILIVDDEQLVCRMLEETLGGLGYTVTAMTRPEEALRRFLNDPLRYDMLLTDNKMPEITGVELAEQALSARPGLPVLLITGHADGFDSKTAEKLGIKNIFLKPLVEEELAKAVRKTLDKKEDCSSPVSGQK